MGSRMMRWQARASTVVMRLWEPHDPGRRACPHHPALRHQSDNLTERRSPEGEVEADGMLSEEHAPPESLGGEVVCLTCLDCNSSAGSQLDFHMRHREALIDFLSGLDTDDLNARFTIGSVTQRGVVRMTGGAVRGPRLVTLPSVVVPMPLGGWCSSTRRGTRAAPAAPLPAPGRAP